MTEPTRARDLLAKELLRVRDLAGLSGRELARRIGLSQPSLSRIDRGRALPSVPQVQQWLAECDADPVTVERVLALTEAAHAETRPWGELLEERQHLQDMVRAHDAEAVRIRNFQPTVVPGLLQTALYARSILAFGRTDQKAALAARLEYQQVLHEPGRRFEFVISERALRWEPSPGALVGQMDRIASLATLDTVEIAVLRADVAALIPWHNFVIRDLTDSGAAYVTTELFHGAQQITAPDSVALYAQVWQKAYDASAKGADALELIRAALD